MKPTHAKPSLYAYYFEILKEIAKEYGYNLVIHGSLNRDLDLIAIPWQEEIKPFLPMIEKFALVLGGAIIPESDEKRDEFAKKYHGRRNYIININRNLIMKYNGFGQTEIKQFADPQFYIDISITPIIYEQPIC